MTYIYIYMYTLKNILYFKQNMAIRLYLFVALTVCFLIGFANAFDPGTACFDRLKIFPLGEPADFAADV